MNYTKERTRQLIMQATKQMLEKQYFESITVRDICTCTKIHRSTFYRHYEDKYQLLVDLLNYYAIEINEYTEKCATQEEIYRAALDFVDERRKVFRHMLRNRNEALKTFTESYSKAMLAAAYKGDTPRAKHIRTTTYPQIICDFYSNGLITVIMKWLNDDYPLSKEDFIEALIETI